jgi:hypothetical protein
MKRTILIGLLLVCVFIVGCGSEKFVCPNGETVSNADECIAKEPVMSESTSGSISTPASETTTETITELSISKEVQRTLDTIERFDSVAYDYKDLSKPKDQVYNFWIKNNMVKRELAITTGVLHQNEMDVVIFDRSAGSAQAYCEQEDYCKITGEYGYIDYDQYNLKTPLDWLDRIEQAERIGSETLFGRDTIKVNANNGEFTIWIESYYGIPLKVQIDGQDYEFRNPKFNNLDDNDVEFVVRS